MLDLPVSDEVKELGLKAAKALGITTTIVDMIRSKRIINCIYLKLIQ